MVRAGDSHVVRRLEVAGSDLLDFTRPVSSRPVSSLPAEMPKIKSAASGRHEAATTTQAAEERRRWGQPRELGSPWVGTSGGTEPGQGRSSGRDSETGRRGARVPEFARATSAGPAPPLTFLHGRVALKQSV